MTSIIFFIFLAIIVFNAFSGKSSKVKQKTFKSLDNQYSGRDYQHNGGAAHLASRLNAAKRAAQTGAATGAKYQHVRHKRRQAELSANKGLLPSKDRQDKNRNRRTDWGARGDSALFSPKMIMVIGGSCATIYWALTAFSS
ncbi:MAG: hypothetical protein ABJ275_04100 [Maricaulaceae bacterium]